MDLVLPSMCDDAGTDWALYPSDSDTTFLETTARGKLVSPLCQHCGIVPLDPEKLQNKSKAVQFKLGTAAWVRSSNCRLCQLLSLALYHTARLSRTPPAPDSDELAITWQNFQTTAETYFLIELLKYKPTSGSSFVLETFVSLPIRIYFGRTAKFVSSASPNLRISEPTSVTYLTPNRGLAVNTSLLRHWVNSCVTSHGATCSFEHISAPSTQILERHPGLKTMRLIDVQERCIVEGVVDVDYVALSYLWGLAGNFRLTTTNRQHLIDVPRSLDKYWDSLPRTIQDAITFVRDMDQRYLWCDALCLIQNDQHDMSLGLDVMDYIYERAFFTIVGACGHDADAGLPGVLPGSRIRPGLHDEIVPGVKLELDISLDLCLRSSAYISRGWTFQEEVLSRRIIYFVDSRVYFRCQYITRSEFAQPRDDTKLADSISYHISASRKIRLLLPVVDFSDMVHLYSQRALTYQADALNAMRGIVRRVSDRMKCGFLEGIPVSVFEAIILFRKASKSHLRRREMFPSYSWTGWIGALSMVQQEPTNTNNWLAKSTWIVWYVRSPDGSCRLVWDPTANPEFPWHDPQVVGYRTRAPFPITSLNIATDTTHPSSQLNEGKAPKDVSIRGYHLLQFWTLSVFFQLKDIDTQHSIGHLWDTRDCAFCGFLYLDGLGDTRLYEDNSTGKSFEIILLSSTKPYMWVRSEPSAPHWYWERIYRSAAGIDDQAYNVMLLEWIGDVAERRGIGFILESCIPHSLAPGPVWKEIVLA